MQWHSTKHGLDPKLDSTFYGPILSPILGPVHGYSACFVLCLVQLPRFRQYHHVVVFKYLTPNIARNFIQNSELNLSKGLKEYYYRESLFKSHFICKLARKVLKEYNRLVNVYKN